MNKANNCDALARHLGAPIKEYIHVVIDSGEGCTPPHRLMTCLISVAVRHQLGRESVMKTSDFNIFLGSSSASSVIFSAALLKQLV